MIDKTIVLKNVVIARGTKNLIIIQLLYYSL